MGVITESLGMRPAGSGVEQPDIGDRSCPEDPHEDEEVLRIEVFVGDGLDLSSMTVHCGRLPFGGIRPGRTPCRVTVG